MAVILSRKSGGGSGGAPSGAAGGDLSGTYPNPTLVAGAAWDLTVDLPLTTGTDWGMTTGWTNDGAKMIVGTDATQRRNQYQTILPLGSHIIEVDIQIPTSSRSAADQRAGVLVNWDGSGTNFPLVMLQFANKTPAANGVIDTELDAISVGPSVTNTFALDTWHTIRILRAGENTVVYFNGTLKATFALGVGVAIVSYIGLYGYGVDAWFRNLKVWTPSLP